MENSLVTYGFTKYREGIENFKYICDLCCLAICIYLYSTLHSLQLTKKNGNVTAKNYLKESLSFILCFIIQENGSSGNGLILKIILLRMVIPHNWLSCLHARNEIGRFFASNSKYYV